jgi:hypothetical protein
VPDAPVPVPHRQEGARYRDFRLGAGELARQKQEEADAKARL